MINFIISRSSAQPILRSGISPRYNLLSMQKPKMKHPPTSHHKLARKSKIKNSQTQKIDASHNDHIFYHTATAPRIMLLAAFFTRVCSSQTRSFAATQQKIVFIIFKMLMFTSVRFVLCPIAISVIILLKVNARL